MKKLTVVEGKVEAKDGNKLRIDGTWYDKSANFKKLSDYTEDTFSVGDEYKLVLEGEKYYVCADTISAETDFAMVLRTQKGITDQVKLLLADGTEKTFGVHKDSTVKVVSTSPSGNNIMIDNESAAVMVKYETLKSGSEVKMTLVDAVTDAASAEVHSFDKKTKELTTFDDTDETTQVVSGDAIAFIYYSAGDDSKWKVFNANTTSNIDAKNQTAAYVGTKSGKIAAFALTTETMPTGTGDSTKYGFVTGKVETTYGSDNEKGTEFTVWNGEEAVTVLVEGTSLKDKGDFVKYTVSDNAISDSEFEKLTDSATIVKVKENDTKRNLLITTTETYGPDGVIDGEDTTYVMNSDTVVIGIKKDGNKKSDNNTIQVYTKISGSDYNNAALILGTGEDAKVVKAIFVDEDNKMNDSGNYVVLPDATVPTVTLKAADSNGITVTDTTKALEEGKSTPVTCTSFADGSADSVKFDVSGTASTDYKDLKVQVGAAAAAAYTSGDAVDLGSATGSVTVKVTLTAIGSGKADKPCTFTAVIDVQ